MNDHDQKVERTPTRQGGKGKNGPPSNNNFSLPTIDASPILDPTLFIKKSSKSNHTIAGCDAARRLLNAQHKVRSQIWNGTRGAGGGGHGNGKEGDYGLLEERREEQEHYHVHNQSNEYQFGLVGHGVPYQLLQDHVDCAWSMLNQLGSTSARDGGRGYENENVIESIFLNKTGRLDFDWVKIRKRNGTTFNLDSTNKQHHRNLNNLQHELTLYLTVMSRISTTFGTILQTQPTNESYRESLAVTNDKYWKNDILTPMKYWKTTFKRGFVYPPSRSASAAVFARYDLGVNELNHGRDLWTGPPIVELIPSQSSSSSSVHENDGDDKPNMVRVILQGIPTVFWKDDGFGGSAATGGDSDMVPVSLVFESCFKDQASTPTNNNQEKTLE